VVLREFPGYHWIYWVGPALGSILAVIFYRVIKMLEYETANPGQDFDAHEADAFSFDEENAATASDVMPPNGDVMRMKSNSNFSGDDHMGGPGPTIADVIYQSSESLRPSRTLSASQHYNADHSNYPANQHTTTMTSASSHGTLSAGQNYVADHPNVVATSSHGVAEAYHAGPDAEKGELGGNYTVSGLRRAS